MPSVTHARVSRMKGGMRRGIRFFAWAVAAGGAMASPSRAQERDTLHLADAVAAARGSNPMLRVARLRADAARARVPQMSAPPDPVVSFRLGNRPLDGFGAGERMTMNTLQVQQTLPWPGKLGLAEARAAHLAVAEELAVLDHEAALVRRVKAVYFELAFEDRALDIMRDTRDLLREFLDVSNTLYAVGAGLQNDVLQAQVAVATMTEDITAAEQARLAMAARLNALLGRGPERNVGALELPGTGEPLPGVTDLMAVATERRPALRAARERIRAAESAYETARRAIYPDLRLGADYAHRPRFADMLSFSVGVSVPLWAGSRQLPMRDEAFARQAAEEAAELELLNETWARIAEARAESDRALRLHDLYATSILPQARAAVESSLSAYRVGQVDFMTLVQSELTVHRYEIERVRLTAAYHSAVAEIEALLGGGTEVIR
ncbi:MAG: TolC family protein [Gemmatimonadales bacterium]|nr:TolC family protein [Gemmatimonadales bacterium]MYG48902.1 TolC family protein [Gemmatimonadales bacterium]MYK02888.1 TolC family protein [Candidatus Palauibacter ramosifaciens]